MKNRKIIGVIDRSKKVRKTTMLMPELKTKYAGFLEGYTHLFLLALDEKGEECKYMVVLNSEDKKYFRHSIDDFGWRVFADSIKKLNDGKLKMVLDAHVYV